MYLDQYRKLVAVLTAAKTTLDLPVLIDAVDITATTTTPVSVPPAYTSGTTPKDILPAPAASTIRKLNGVTIYGRDTAAKTVRVYMVDATPSTGSFTAGAFTVGNTYQITSVGTTDFTLIGASANTVGVIFDATGAGTGTGTASTCYQQIDMTLQIDDTLNYTDVQGWRVITANGVMKTGVDSAVNITNTPSGNIAATNVQSALNELDTEKVGYGGGFNNQCTVGGTANAITLTPAIAITSYAASVGMEYSFVAAGTNTTAVTIAISGLAALSTTMGSVALPVGGIISGNRYRAVIESASSIRVSPFDAASVNGDTINGPFIYTTGLSDNTSSLSLTDAAFVKSQLSYETRALAKSQGVATVYTAAASSGIQVPDNTQCNPGTTDFSLMWRGSLPLWNSPSVTEYLIDKISGSAGAFFGYRLVVSGTQITFTLYRNDAGTAFSFTTPVLTANSTNNIFITIPRETASVAGSVVAYTNGISLGSLAITATSPVTATSTGTLNIAGSAVAAIQTQAITRSAAFFNRALSAAEVLDQNRNGVAFYDKFGSQTLLNVSTCTSTANAYATFTGASATGFHAADPAPANNKNASTADEIPFVQGKYYEVKFDLTLTSGLNPTITARDAQGSGTTISYNSTFTSIAGVTTTGTGSYVLRFWSNTTTTGVINFGTGTSATDYTVSNLSVKAIGATFAIEPESVQPNQWHDVANNNHASYPAGAGPLLWQDKGMYCWTTAITGNTTLTSIIPANYAIEKITFLNSTANAVSVSLGTTPGGTDVINAAALNTSATLGGYKTVVCDQAFSTTVAQTLYLSSAAWNSSSVTFTLYMRVIS